jgi:acyl-CoA hydrolase
MDSNSVKRPADSLTIMNNLVLPNDTNTLDNLMGGRLLEWMDIAAAIAGQKHAHTLAVTAAVNNVSFSNPIKLGYVVTLHAKVIRTFKTSMEIHIAVWAADHSRNFIYRSNDAFYTFVALDPNGNPTHVPEVAPETDEEQQFHEEALMRKQLKLLMAGKASVHQTPELKQQFEAWLSNHEATEGANHQ